MNDSVLTTIAITGFGIAFFHAAIPTHWLPFVLACAGATLESLEDARDHRARGTGHVLFHRRARPARGLAWDRAERSDRQPVSAGSPAEC